jgi:hypothetical protein
VTLPVWRQRLANLPPVGEFWRERHHCLPAQDGRLVFMGSVARPDDTSMGVPLRDIAMEKPMR